MIKPLKTHFLKCLGAFALACGVSSNAAAVDVNVGNLTGNSYVQAYSFAPGLAIHDVFHFDLSAPSSFNAIASQISLPSSFDINGFSLALAFPGSGWTESFSPSGSVISTNVMLLPQGSGFSLTVSGTVDGSIGGSYSLLMAAAETVTTPVPEPAQWLLMLVGLALVTAVAPRRRFPAAGQV